MQGDISLYATFDRLENASFRQKSDPTAKNIFRRQNPLELAVKGVSFFDAQNPIDGSFLPELDIKKMLQLKRCKKDVASILIKKAPNTIDTDIQSRLNELKKI